MGFRKKITVVFFAAIIGMGGGLFTASADEVHFKNGDRLSGHIIRVTPLSVEIKTVHLGEMIIDRKAVDFIRDQADLDRLRVEEEAKASEAEKQDLWKGKITAGVDRRRGNVNSTELMTEGEIKRIGEDTDLLLKGRLYYSEEDRTMTAQKYSGQGRFDYKFGDRDQWFNFYQMEADRDRFANIDYRLVPSAGAGYWLVKKDRFKLMAETGLGYTRTVYRDETDDTHELTLVPRAYLEWYIINKTKLTEEIKIYPSLSNFGEYRLISETILDNPINRHVSIQLRVIDEYNSNAGEAKKNDFRIVSTLAYTF